MAAALVIRMAPDRMTRVNYAGRPVPVVLGLTLVPLIVPVSVGAAAIGDRMVAGRVRGDLVLAGILVLWLAGYLDDILGGQARGLAGHLQSTVRGRPTTGLLKLLAGVAVAVWLALALGGGAVRVGASAVLIAVATNVWNALDVVPGRALKWGIVALIPLVAVSWGGDYGIVAAATLGIAAPALAFDLRERAMLGDAGSNPLGFVVGVGASAFLPTAGVMISAAAALALQAVAETVTISRLVEALPPLRWFDRLGRRK